MSIMCPFFIGRKGVFVEGDVGRQREGDRNQDGFDPQRMLIVKQRFDERHFIIMAGEIECQAQNKKQPPKVRFQKINPVHVKIKREEAAGI